MKIEGLFTRQHAEQSKPMEVTSMEGQRLGVFMQVLGSESTAFLQARREYMRRRLLKDSGKEGDDPILSSEFEYAKMVAVLVTDWDFEDACTPENKLKLFYETPYLASMVENFAASQGNRIAPEKNDSSTGQDKASD